jgi:TRAP-type C4-dicarboxylate transport system permease large subunit
VNRQTSGLLGLVARAAASLAVGVLALSLFLGVAPNLDTRLVELGERWWPGYAKDLREQPDEPSCSVSEIEAQVAACQAAPAPAAPQPTGADPFGGVDPFGGTDPFSAAAALNRGTEGSDGSNAAVQGGHRPALDPFGGDDPFGGAAAAPAAADCQASAALLERCRERHISHQAILERLTPGVQGWRRLELAVARLATWPWWRQLLVLLVLAGGLVTTTQRAHIALREPRTRGEHSLSQAAQLLAHLLLGGSAIADLAVQRRSIAELEDPVLPVLWAVGFGLLGLVNGWHVLRPPAFQPTARSSPARSLMVVPLYAWMVVSSGLYFLLVERHSSGQAIYLHKFSQHPSIYLGVGLYVLAGMLMSVTRVARLVFSVLEPWRLPPTMLAWLAGTASALPTAYTGASGIFVLAAGREIFTTLRRAGASRRLALAATAMSGSLGVVLRPCLLVVLIAVLNKQVTTDELFGRGLLVFALSASIFGVVMAALGRFRWRPAPVGRALVPSLRAVLPLLPHLGVGIGVLLAYRLLLDVHVNEHTAALVVPVLMLAVLAVDRWRGRRAQPPVGEPAAPQVGWSVLVTTTSSHVGALLMLMAASVGLGGVVERARLMELFGHSFSSPVVAMAVLLVFLVLIGMLLEPLGAVVLVSVSLAGLAYDSGIEPAHFWMVVLVAFELGYLTPPVAMNHLLARQAVGEDAMVEEHPNDSFGQRYLHVLVPMGIMALTLLLVAFVPLLIDG